MNDYEIRLKILSKMILLIEKFELLDATAEFQSEKGSISSSNLHE